MSRHVPSAAGPTPSTRGVQAWLFHEELQVEDHLRFGQIKPLQVVLAQKPCGVRGWENDVCQAQLLDGL